jgi:hypothetical protein
LDVEHAERVEGDLDRLIERRDLQRRELEGERLEHEFWEESVARYAARRQRELAQAWLQYHVARQRAHRHTRDASGWKGLEMPRNKNHFIEGLRRKQEELRAAANQPQRNPSAK